MFKFKFGELFTYILGTLFLGFLPSSFIILKTDAKNFDNVSKVNIKNKAKLDKASSKSTDFKAQVELLNTLKKDFKNIHINTFLAKGISQFEGEILNIESDFQSESDNVFVAEGNVVIYLSNGILKSNKVTFDTEKKEFIAEGNVFFEKGKQYFEASKILFNTKTGLGYVNDIYGVIDVINFEKDLDLKTAKKKNLNLKKNGNSIRDLSYINTSKFGFVSDYSSGKSLDIKDVDFDIPSVSKWRFKTKKLFIKKNKIESKRIFFTNDPYNEPQFKLLSKNFVAEIIEDKVKFLSKNTWINLDDQLKLPIGRWTIFDRDRLSKWSIGSDYDEKDGFFISRAFDDINLNQEFTLQIEPYYLIQRSIKGTTNAFREPNASIFSEKVKNSKKFSDNFGLGINLIGKINAWDVDLTASSNTFNIDRLSEGTRSKLTLTRSFELDQKKNNFIDLQLFNAFREKVSRGYDGDAEIYFANGLSLSNTRSWDIRENRIDLSFIYDLGEYNAERKNLNSLESLTRNYFGMKIDNEIPLWKKDDFPKNITKEYVYTPKIINSSIYWRSNINAGLSFYSNGFTQEGITFNTGPHFTFGSFKKKFLDYSNLSATYTYVIKTGESPFVFDDINKDSRIRLEMSQQIYGPILFVYEAYMPLDVAHNDYGNLIDPRYRLEIKRRAYSLAAYYSKKDESIGIQFNIFNFDYAGFGKRF